MRVPLLSVVIPAYRRRDSVLQLLGDLYRQTHSNFEVIVVEDCGQDGTSEAVAEHFPQVILIQNSKNSGPSVSRNRGIQAARGEIVAGLDSDVSISDPELLVKVANTFAELPQASGLAFRLLTPDGIGEDTPRWWHPVPIVEFAEKRFSTSYFSGTAYAFRRAAVLAAGLFPEILFMDLEEVELAYRVLDNGGSIFYCPALKVLHHANPVARRSEVKVFFKPRNQVLIAVSCLPVGRAILYLVPRVGYQFLQASRGRHLFDFFRAMRSGLTLLPRQLESRKPLHKDTFRRIRNMRRGNLA